MAKDPAVLFYTGDFLTGTLTMTNEHVGMYIKLLCLQHQKGKLDEKDMIYICKTYVEDVYLKFTYIDGKYYNERMFNESEKRKKYSESRRNNVKKRYSKSKSNKNPSKKDSTYVVHMENENENENKDKDVSIIKETYITMFKEISEEFELSQDLKDIFLVWLKYKAEKGQSYKPIGMKTLIKSKLQETLGNPEVLKSWVVSSISNNYAGLFPAKGDQKNGANQKVNAENTFKEFLRELENDPDFQ